MSAVAHTYRLSILNELVQNGELKCCDVEGITGLSKPTCSHHIKLLAESELIDCRKHGRSNYISINKASFKKLGVYFEKFVE